MKKEDAIVLQRLLNDMRDEVKKLEEARYQKDSEEFSIAKKKILELQKKINEKL